jgi:GAF domain-containing protein
MMDKMHSDPAALSHRKSAWIRTSADISRVIVNSSSLEGMLNKVVEKIWESTGFYHIAVYLLDQNGEWAVLQAAAGATGEMLIKSSIKVMVGQEGMVGYVARHGEPRVTQDVSVDPFQFTNPALPETLSEAALPVKKSGHILGVLDVHSIEKAAFNQDSISILQNIADQLAVAIENFNLAKDHRTAVNELQMTLEASRKAYSEISREAWSAYIRSRSDLAFVCDARDQISEAPKTPDSEIYQSIHSGRIVLDETGELALPIKIREQVMGVVRLKKPESFQEWTEDEIDLMENLVDQLGMALESARLYNDTQKRAEKERLISDITSKIRASTNLDVILQTAVQQLAEALQAPRGSIVLRGDE